MNKCYVVLRRIRYGKEEVSEWSVLGVYNTRDEAQKESDSRMASAKESPYLVPNEYMVVPTSNLSMA